jgi:hypothetical protein
MQRNAKVGDNIQKRMKVVLSFDEHVKWNGDYERLQSHIRLDWLPAGSFIFTGIFQRKIPVTWSE